MSAEQNKTTTAENGDMASSKDIREQDDNAAAEPQTTATGGDAGESLTPEQIEALKAKAAKADENWDRLLRLTADFDNYKKRAARERQEAVKYANESLMETIIPIMDNFDMAMLAANNPQANAIESLKTGVAMIHNQLRNLMQESGLEEIDAANKPFDPTWHEAISQQETADVPEGQVVQQIRKGYKLRDRLIRPASVVVSKKPAN